MNLRLTAKKTARRGIGAEARVHAAANAYCLRTYGDSYIGATPRLLSLASVPVWVMPVMFTSAGHGQVGAVGVVAVDPNSLEILDATPRGEVRASGARLAREKRDDLDAAFRRARAT